MKKVSQPLKMAMWEMPKKWDMPKGKVDIRAMQAMTKTKPQGKWIVKALGQKWTTGNFKKIEAKSGKGAAIWALQNKLAAHRGLPTPFGGKKK